MALSDRDRKFLAAREARKTMGLYGLPAVLAVLVLVWGGFYVFLPLTVNPFYAVGHFEGQPIAPGTVTTYAMSAALLMNLAFALGSAILVVAIAFARFERRYLKLLALNGDVVDAPAKPGPGA